MKNKSNTAISDEALPDIIKRKLESYKIEGRLVNNKDFKLDNYLSIKANDNIKNKKIKVMLEVVSYTSLKRKPVIPSYGKIITEILKVILTDVKGAEIKKKDNFSCSIKAIGVDPYCYPLLFRNDSWKIAEKFCIENDGICILDGEWDIVILVKECPNEIISITSNGGIMYCELDKVTNLRIPKGIFKEALNCKIQFVNIKEDIIEEFRMVYEEQLSPFVQMSAIFLVERITDYRDLVNDPQTFRRVISVKIPLPDWVISRLKEINFDTKRIVQNQMKEKLGFYFLQKNGETWTFFEGHLRFTQNSLGFDIKHFGKFIFVKCRENREIRLCKYMNFVESLQSSEMGVILVFLYIKNQNWYLWIEAVAISRITLVRVMLQNNGLLFVEQHYEHLTEEDDSNNHKRKRRISKIDVLQRRTFELFENIQFELTIKGEIERCDSELNKSNNNKSTKPKDIIRENNDNDHTFNDLEHIGKRKVVSFDCKGAVEELVSPDLSYHSCSYSSNAVVIPIKPINKTTKEWTTIILDRLQRRSIYESNRLIKSEVINVPSDDIVKTDIDLSLIELTVDDKFNASRLSVEEKNINFQCEISVKVLNPSAELSIIPTQKFEFYISVDTMKDYFNVLTKDETEELELERLRLQKEETIKESQQEEYVLVKHNVPDKPRTVNYSRINVLSNPRTTNISLIKDSKVISTKSLLALSSVIRQGLTLAVYLYLPENVIAGIGFDSLSQISMNGINNTTYKVLVTWKKMIHMNKIKEEIYVEQLMDAFKMLNYENLATMVHNHWENNKEITTEDCQRCLLKRKE